MVLSWWEALVIRTSTRRTVKSELAWTTKEEKHTTVNSKTLHAIFFFYFVE